MVNKTRPDLIECAERRAFVLSQRKAGYTYAQIAALTIAKFGKDRLPDNYDERTAHKDVARELQRLRKDTRQDTADLVQMELERLDAAMKAIAKKIQGGNLSAIDRWVRISESRRKLLGLDESVKQSAAISGDVRVTIIREAVKGKHDDSKSDDPAP